VFESGDIEIKEGDLITIDGASGKVMLGEVPTVKPSMSGDFSKLMNWADQYRKLKVRTNSETPIDTKIARDFGAEGIGLCRTEHMFFDEKRIISVREMILSKTREDRERALTKLLPYQKGDFFEIFKIMNGLPVTVRLLDPPLHEFLPKTNKDVDDISKELNISHQDIKSRIIELHEQNPFIILKISKKSPF
jgi:pyruvate,orthophosphate dikinase